MNIIIISITVEIDDDVKYNRITFIPFQLKFNNPHRSLNIKKNFFFCSVTQLKLLLLCFIKFKLNKVMGSSKKLQFIEVKFVINTSTKYTYTQDILITSNNVHCLYLLCKQSKIVHIYIEESLEIIAFIVSNYIFLSTCLLS